MRIENGGRERGEGLWAAAYLVFWQAWAVVEQGVPAGPGSWDTVTSQGREVRRGWSMGSTNVGRGKGRLLLVC